MASKNRKLLLTPKLYHRYQTQFGEKHNKFGQLIQENRFKCRKCGEKFEIGDWIVTKPTRYGKRCLYHAECWESMFYNVEDELETTVMVKNHVLVSNN